MEARPNSELKNKLTDMLEVVVLPERSVIHQQCIYKVPQYIRQANPQAYTPNVISIGPFHSPHGTKINSLHGTNSENNILLEMEELKLKYLKAFLNRTTNISVDDLVLKVQKWENEIRDCYAGPISFDSDNFLKIIIVDACFIIEHFLRYASYTDWMENDPIFIKEWLRYTIYRDLILIENQLPFFILEKIYKLANKSRELPSFITITLYYFEVFNNQNIKPETLCPKHFTDLRRTFLLPLKPFDFAPQEMGKPSYVTEHVCSASQLSEAGLKFELSESKCLLDLEFDKGVLKMPCFLVDPGTETDLRNIIAFEECHFSDKRSAYISQYFCILGFLLGSEKDVTILADKQIIVNWMRDGNEVSTMVNNLCRELFAAPFNSNYLSICHELISMNNPINKYKAIFLHDYFNTPWKIASTITAVLLVLLTLIQAVCSIWSLVKS